MARILIVDDSPTEMYKLTAMLEKHGHQVLKAENGADGVALARQEKPDAVLMDIVMPGLNGFQATRQLTKDAETSHIPVIIVTTKDQETDKVWGKRQGAKDYLTKPVDEDTLLKTLNAVLAGVSNVEALYSDLLKDVDGEFDLIVANPPYMLDADSRAYRDGGGELGIGLSQAIVEAAIARLAPGGSLLLYTGVAMTAAGDPFLAYVKRTLGDASLAWRYEEVDPDVFGEELLKPGYEQVERIAAVVLTVTRTAG